MADVNVVALSKMIKDDALSKAREGMEPGTYEVDCTLAVKGSITVGKDTEKIPTVSIPMIETLTLVLKYSGCTGPAALAAVQRAMSEALALSPEGRGALLAAYPEIAQAQEAVKKMCASLPKTKVKGAVRTDLSYEILDSKQD